MAFRFDTATTLRESASASPFAAARPTRTPVKVPGPDADANPSISASLRPWRASRVSISPNKTWSKPSPGGRTTSSMTRSPSVIAILARLLVVSIERILICCTHSEDRSLQSRLGTKVFFRIADSEPRPQGAIRLSALRNQPEDPVDQIRFAVRVDDIGVQAENC